MIDFDIDICPHCGTEINYAANSCPECEGILPEDASFCPYCGVELEDVFYCDECHEVINAEDIEKYNQLSDKERATLHEEYLRKKAEQEAEHEALVKQLNEERKKNDAEAAINKAKEDAEINELADYIKSQIPFDCKLKISLSFTSVEIEAKNMGYSIYVRFYKEERERVLANFIKALITIHEVSYK